MQREMQAVDDEKILTAIKDLDKIYNIGKSKTFDAKVVGGENTRRPLDFSGKVTITNTKSLRGLILVKVLLTLHF